MSQPSRVTAWAAQAPGRRAVLPAAGTAWTAAQILHHVSVSGTTTGFGSALLAAGLYIATRSPRAALTAAAAGAWFTAATAAGPLSGPHHLLTLAAAAGALGAWLVARRSRPAAEAREKRAAHKDWYQRRHKWGLHDAHLLEWEPTRLGASWLLDTTETGQLASSLTGIGSHLPERIAQTEKLHPSRVTVTPGRIAGRVRIAIRERDPWEKPIAHPVLVRDPELELPVPCSVRDPLVVGIIPETGKPLLLPVWLEGRGARNVQLLATPEGGKTVLLSDIRERFTAACDGLLFDINVSKALEDAEWEPACDLAAVGDGERRRALGILLVARAVIAWRAAQPRDTAVFQPTAADPLIGIVIDEIDELTDGGDALAAAIKRELSHVASKGRSEAVGLVLAGQRGTADWMGGAKVRAMINVVCAGKVNRESESNHLGAFAKYIPDMSEYGEGKPGVWAIAELGGHTQKGRAFNLESPLDLRRLAHERAGSQPSLPAGLVEYLGPLYAELKGWAVPAAVGTAAAGQQAEASGSYSLVTPDLSPVAVADRPGGLDALDAELNASLAPEMRDELRRMSERDAATRTTLAEADKIIGGLPPSDPMAEQASAEDRWRQAAAQTEIPPDMRARLLDLLSGDGMSTRDLAERLGVSRHKIILWLNRLRFDGTAQPNGKKGRAGRWILTDGNQSEGP